jgi:hypothetical protein
MKRKLQENVMTSKLRIAAVLGAAAILTSAIAVPAADAHMRYRHHYGHDYGYNDGGDDLAAGIFGFAAGALVGSALSNSYDDNSCYRFRTYNPRTGMYMSYDGWRHCP